MERYLDLLIQVITLDIFIGYGVYTFIWILTSSFWKNEFLKRLDSSANQLLSISGLLYLLVLLPYFMNSLSEPPKNHFWWFPWIQSIIWIFISQLLWIKKIRVKSVLRIIFSFLFIISFERYIILMTSFHSDYVPGSWKYFSPIQMIFGLFIKAGIFSLIATIYQLSKDKIVGGRTN